VIGAVVFWLVEAAALVLILRKQSGADYRRKAARL
jgi:hypothetical protein